MARTFEAASEAKAAAQVELLRSAILDAFAINSRRLWPQLSRQPEV
jgi:hypothetical protein